MEVVVGSQFGEGRTSEPVWERMEKFGEDGVEDLFQGFPFV